MGACYLHRAGLLDGLLHLAQLLGVCLLELRQPRVLLRAGVLLEVDLLDLSARKHGQHNAAGRRQNHETGLGARRPRRQSGAHAGSAPHHLEIRR